MTAPNGLVQRIRERYHTGRYRKVREWLQEGTVLDIGCGRPCDSMPDGAFIQFLGRGAGVDIRPCAGPFPFVQADLLHLPFPDRSFDNVVAMEVLEHVTDPDQALFQIDRVLRDDGRLVVSFPDESWLWDRIWSVWERTYGTLWRGTHTGTLDRESWLTHLARYFLIQDSRRHWYFDLLFKLRKRV